MTWKRSLKGWCVTSQLLTVTSTFLYKHKASCQTLNTSDVGGANTLGKYFFMMGFLFLTFKENTCETQAGLIQVTCFISTWAEKVNIDQLWLKTKQLLKEILIWGGWMLQAWQLQHQLLFGPGPLKPGSDSASSSVLLQSGSRWQGPLCICSSGFISVLSVSTLHTTIKCSPCWYLPAPPDDNVSNL